MVTDEMQWAKLMCNHRELQLVGTLNGGQSFRWTYNQDTDEWTGVFSKTAWKLRQKNDYLEFKVLGSLLPKLLKHDTKVKNGSTKTHEESIFTSLLEKYFRLNVNLGSYYKEWSDKDELFKSACQQFYGIRMLNQQAVENLFSFICSQNNHISRISAMVEKLCTHYGEEICKHEGVSYYTFPEVEKLADPQVESQLRDLGFGYRAKFIQKSASQILEAGGLQWFKTLRDMKYKEAKQELMKLHGIGPKSDYWIVPDGKYTRAGVVAMLYMRWQDANARKTLVVGGVLLPVIGYWGVYLPKLPGFYRPRRNNMDMPFRINVADCICLMSLDHLEALPVDTHVYQIAAQNYLPHLRGKKNVTEKMYAEIGDHFRTLYGDLAGWAHTVLFCADLKKFQNVDNKKVDEGVKAKKKRKY